MSKSLLAGLKPMNVTWHEPWAHSQNLQYVIVINDIPLWYVVLKTKQELYLRDGKTVLYLLLLYLSVI
jgi:hypothetical protein